MKFFLLSIIILAICSCKEAKKDTPKIIAAVANSIPTLPVNNPGSVSLHWADTLVVKYINANIAYFNRLKDKDTIATEWHLDSRENTDSAHYLIFEIGHSFEYHFITDKWLYIDSVSKNIYEYDLPNERLTKWAH